MKNNYRKLKLSILLQTVFITALTVLVGRFILEYFIDGIYNDSFANGFLRILEAFHVSEETATSLYWQCQEPSYTSVLICEVMVAK